MAKKNNQTVAIALIAIILVVGIFVIAELTGELTDYKPPEETSGMVGQVTFEILPPEPTTTGGKVNPGTG